MNAVHIVLLALSCCCLAAGAAGGRWLSSRGTDVRTIQTMSAVIGTALAIGNAACLLPATPHWYSVAMVAATAAGLVWLAVSVASARQPQTVVMSRPAAQAVTEPQLPPALRLVRGTAEPVQPASGTVVTSEMIYDQGPAGARRTAGQGVYVAAHLGDYLPEHRNPRRRHAAPTAARHSNLESAAFRARLARAYAQDRPSRDRPQGRSTLA